ncbi:exonuclease domain-containing protein [Bacillus sp. FJAT-27916]|uniref:exonuclease domain-containing protein n=1 Tax=Bacillus sp. FJAT-27916 TaxID=1679169 RepID=UPI000AA0E12B|nr:exonuclease domain-containing protein [Bacillus sp. FJAT-27916]
MNDFIQFFRGMGGKISSNVLAGMQGQPSAQSISFLRQLEKEVRQKDDLSCPLKDLEVVVFDIETTGFHPDKGDQILSIGAVKMKGAAFCEEDTFYSLIKNDGILSTEIRALTNITDEQLQDAPEAHEVLMQFFQFISSRILIAHHSKHEMAFMRKITWNLMKKRFQHRMIDTSFLTNLLTPGPQTIRTLDQLCEECGIEIKNRHHALGDALMTGSIWAYYLQKAIDEGYKNLGDVYSELAKKRG